MGLRKVNRVQRTPDKGNRDRYDEVLVDQAEAGLGKLRPRVIRELWLKTRTQSHTPNP
jgi:hypothetical protein